MLVFSSIFAIYSTTVTVLLANSSDLDMGRRPMFKSNEFAKRTVTVVQKMSIETCTFPILCYTY